MCVVVCGGCAEQGTLYVLCVVVCGGCAEQGAL